MPGVFVIANCNGRFRAVRSDELCAALIAHGDIGIVVPVIQPNHAAVVFFRNLDVVSALAQRRACRAGLLHICPVAIIAGGGAGFHNDEFPLIALCVVHRAAGIKLSAIRGVVDHGIGAVLIALHAVAVVSRCIVDKPFYSQVIRHVCLRDRIPLIHLVQRSARDLSAGFTVHLAEIDLQAPFVVAHEVSVAAVHGHSDGLLAALCAAPKFKAIGDDGFIKTEIERGELFFCRRDGSVHHPLGFSAKLALGGALRAGGGRIRFRLTLVRPFSSAEAGHRRLAHFIPQSPAGGRLAAVILVVAILCMAVGSDGLHACRSNGPSTSVNDAALFQRFDLYGRAVNLFTGFKLLLIHIDGIACVEAAAGRLRCGVPACVIFRDRGRDVGVHAAGGRADHRHRLPAWNRWLVNICIIVTVGSKRRGAARQLFRCGKVTAGGQAVRIMLHDPELYIVIVGVCGFQYTRLCFRAARRKGGCGKFIRMPCRQHIERQLAQPAPNVHLVGIMVAGGVLIRSDKRCV